MGEHHIAPDPDAPRKITRIVNLEVEEVRDLQIVMVPVPWQFLRNDDHIKARLAQETQQAWLSGRRAVQMDGKSREIPHTLGPLREYDITLVRKASDLDGVTVNHPDCQDCIDGIEELRQSFLLMSDNEHPLAAVVQFTYDQIIDGKTEQFDA